MERESDVTRSVIDELHSRDIQGDQMEGERMALLKVSLMNFILRISKAKVVLLEVSLMNFILGITKEIKGKVKVLLLEV